MNLQPFALAAQMTHDEFVADTVLDNGHATRLRRVVCFLEAASACQHLRIFHSEPKELAHWWAVGGPAG
jgi:hypothetical protein